MRRPTTSPLRRLVRRWLPFAIALAFATYPGVLRADFTAADCNDGLGACLQPNNQKRKTPPAQDPCKNGQKSGDPADTYSGSYVTNVTDLMIPGRGLNVEIRRTYRNMGQFNGPFGYNWTFAYYMRARKLTSGNYLVIGETGHELVFHAEGVNSLGENSYCGCELFRHLVEHTDGTLTLFAKDGGRVEFNRNGAVVTVQDRFGNAIRFQYLQDGSGNDVKPPIYGKSKYFIANGGGIVGREYQLVKIIDTYDRQILLSYFGDADGAKTGRLKRVTDFLGRTVAYDYDDAGDLISVTSPPTADFPSGTVTHYTYSANDPNEALSHNLLTLLDGRGRTVLTNGYDSEDRIASQSYGGGTTTWSYDVTARKTTVTDGSGNTTETTFNLDGMPVRVKQFTHGLRQNDPPFFQTLYSYDSHDDLVGATYPRGNSVSYPRSAEGNILSVRRVPVNAQPGGPNDIVSSYTYEPLFNQLATATDERGFLTTYLYDYQEGNDLAGLAARLGLSSGEVSSRLVSAGIAIGQGDLNGDGRTDQIGGRVVKTVYPTATVQGAPQTIEKRYTYNDAGQPLSMTDPEGNITRLDYHRRDDPDGDGVPLPGSAGPDHTGYLRSITRAAGTADETTTSFVYDAAGNPAFLTDGLGNTSSLSYDAQNRLVRIVAPAPFSYEAHSTYDAAGNLQQIDIANTNEAGQPDSLNPWFTSLFTYDDWGRVTSVSREIDASTNAVESYVYSPTGKLVQQTRPESNVNRFDYDERDRLLRSRRGYGTGLEAVTTFNYDLNGRLNEVIDARSHSTNLAYDDLDRLSRVTNALGHHTDIAYDKAGHVVSASVSSASDLLISEIQNQYDERGRLFQQSQLLLDAAGQQTGSATTELVYDRSDRVRNVIDPDSRHLSMDYDGVDRLVELRDSAGNREHYVYDAAGNVSKRTTTDINEGGGSPSVIEVDYDYDPMNRLIRITDMLGRLTRFHYDSRSDPTQVVDGEGNTTSWTYDGLRHRRSLARVLRDAAGNPIGSAVETYRIDRNGRLTDITNDDGVVTHFTYDALDRPATTVFGYGTGSESSELYTYDATNNRLTRLARNGVGTSYAYDDINRLISQTGGPYTDSYQYDGLNRIVRGVVTNSGSVESTVDLVHDSLGRIVRETQDGLDIASTFDGAGNRMRLTYPDNSFVTDHFTTTGHLADVRDASNGLIASFAFLGSQRVAGTTFGNGTTMAETYDPTGLETARTFTAPSGPACTEFDYGYDRAGHRLFETHSFESGGGDAYQYDSLYRLRNGWFGVSASDIQNIRNAISSGTTPPAPVNFASQTSYVHDDLDNRIAVTRGTSTLPYAHDPLDQYTVAEGTAQGYDNGNLVDDGVLQYTYDYLNRLRTVRRKSDNALVATYTYDALGRRIRKQLPSGAGSRYLYDGESLIEERDQTNVVVSQFVYGYFVDQPLMMKRGGQTYYYQDNGLGSIAAMTDSQGTLVERYSYDHFGRPTIRNAAGTVVPASLVGNPWMFAGRQYDPESGLYQNRARYLSPLTGRFLSVDPLGPLQQGNRYGYALQDPIDNVDPFGLEALHQQGNSGFWISSDLPFGPTPPTTAGIDQYLNFVESKPWGSWGFKVPDPSGDTGFWKTLDDISDGAKSVKNAADNVEIVTDTTEKTFKVIKNFIDSWEMPEVWVEKLADGSVQVVETTETAGGRLAGGIAEGFGKVAKGAGTVSKIANTVVVVIEGVQGARSIVQAIEDPDAFSRKTLEGDYGTTLQSASMIGHVISGESDQVLSAAEHNLLGKLGIWLGEHAESAWNATKEFFFGAPPHAWCK